MTEGHGVHQAALAFDRAGDAYERGRPSYPPEAVSCLVDSLRIGPGATVLDLAAGTGKLTRLLAPTGARVIAVEPASGMRQKLVDSAPGVEAIDGTAEAVPLQDGSVDAVTVAQAFHWFDGDKALAEIHRVLAPGGRLGIIWNRREESEPWIVRLGELIEPYRGDAPRYLAHRWRDAFDRTTLFTPLEHARFELVHETDPDGIVARVTSISFVAGLSDDERAALSDRVRALLDEDPMTHGRERLGLPYHTDVYWCERV
ncbi:MAG TPA: methyltransferase domain-containing protein [Gaiellaceae bacterium]